MSISCLPEGLGHIDPKFISKEEYHFFFPSDEVAPNCFDAAGIVRGISYTLFKERKVENSVATVNGAPAWISNLNLAEYRKMIKVENFLSYLLNASHLKEADPVEVLADVAA